MVIDAVLGGALITACCGLLAAIISKLRCRFLVNNQSDDGLDWNFACGFTEIRLPPPESRAIESIPLQGDTLYVKKAD